MITLGRKTPGGFPGAGAIPVVEVERGGEATYHGPGQLVAYPIVHLTEARRDLHRFQRDLEEIGIRVCADLGLDGRPRRGQDGRVDRAAQGDEPRDRGPALGDVARAGAQRDHRPRARSALFNPCGLDGAVMTSLSEGLGTDPGMDRVRASLLRHAGELLPGGPFAPASLDSLLARLPGLRRRDSAAPVRAAIRTRRGHGPPSSASCTACERAARA